MQKLVAGCLRHLLLAFLLLLALTCSRLFRRKSPLLVAFMGEDGALSACQLLGVTLLRSSWMGLSSMVNGLMDCLMHTLP